MSNAKMRMRCVLACMYLVRRSLGRNGCEVKKTMYFLECLLATNWDFHSSKVLSSKCRLCTGGYPFSGERLGAALWRCWLAPRCCILPRAALSSTNIRMGPTPPAISVRRCTCRRWKLPGWTSPARLRSLSGILRCRSTQRRAILFLCIAPGAHLLPPDSSRLTRSVFPCAGLF